jgi:hypothetical protein
MCASRLVRRGNNSTATLGKKHQLSMQTCWNSSTCKRNKNNINETCYSWDLSYIPTNFIQKRVWTDASSAVTHKTGRTRSSTWIYNSTGFRDKCLCTTISEKLDSPSRLQYLITLHAIFFSRVIKITLTKNSFNWPTFILNPKDRYPNRDLICTRSIWKKKKHVFCYFVGLHF